ncbi:MAG: FHA domain-containing protein [Verrucomicrobiota bacterium]
METVATQRLSKIYLVVDDDVIYEVSPNTVLNIGRLGTNDIVLDDYKVSREHAVLKFSKGEMILVDLASTHGSFVNGDRVERCPVQFGDTIRIVNHELTLFRELPEDRFEASVIKPKGVRSLDRRLKFFGGLNEFSLLTLVQFLHQEKQSGLLLLELGQNPGPRIYFQHGDIIHVSQGDNLAELLVRARHEESLFFYFHHEEDFPRRTIHEPTPIYLVDLCHAYDERRARAVTQTGGLRALRADGETERVRLPLP